MIMSNLENNDFTFDVVDEIVKETPKVKKKAKNAKTGVVKNNDQESTFVMPEVIEFEEIDECLIFNKKGKRFAPTFNSYEDKDKIRFYNNEKDWDLLRGLIIMKCIRKNKHNQKVVLDDIVEFRLLPKDWAEELCNYLFRNEFNFVVYEDEND